MTQSECGRIIVSNIGQAILLLFGKKEYIEFG